MLATAFSIKGIETMPIRYDIIDKVSGAIVATAKTRKGASKAVDRRDNAYGAYRYSARPIYA